MNDTVYTGILEVSGRGACLRDDSGIARFEGERIWDGYITHWAGKKVCARRLAQRDYETGNNIIIMWPGPSGAQEPFVELYFNERLVKYPASLLGHLAINVNGSIFNFSHLLNENEALRHEEYFFRPALGEFAPHPVTMRFDRSDPDRPYYDKFGRLFMRSIHVLRLTGIDTAAMKNIFDSELRSIYDTGGKAGRPEKYAGFNLFTRSCATIIRDGLAAYGFTGISGIFPRDLFVNAAYYFFTGKDNLGITVSMKTLKQLVVPEAPLSAMAPLLNPFNRIRQRRIERISVYR
ncbi:MAG TPA: hypothetical protein PK926_09615 [Spirochaetota bacterium]|nr:hypothetical protein [Spirochaetota bacterium]HPI90163.1 hypothetical protein [Spirochaetota bacterium]HPR48922.1 hypothetical protein [Spirochaetota bacterium]